MILALVFIITILYLALIGSFIYGFDKVPTFDLRDIPARTTFSVIIPFRDEAQQLPTLLQSLSELNYSKNLFEVIFIDDASTDDSIKIIQSTLAKIKAIDFIIIPNERFTASPKKDAVTTAISKAKYDWILTTDADCQLPRFWLDTYDHFIQDHQSKVVASPVTYNHPERFFTRFQLLDMLSLQGATIGGFGIGRPFLCNGANLAYRKDLFVAINGFQGNSDIASGDDIFLLEKAVKHSQKDVHYLKSNKAIVTTLAQANFKGLKAQRIRWAAKTSHYNNAFGKLTGFLVVLMNALIVCMPMLAMAQLLSWKTVVYVFAIKFMVDFLLIFKTARFFSQESFLASYPASSCLYPIFSVYIAFVSGFSGYKWKGRAYKK